MLVQRQVTLGPPEVCLFGNVSPRGIHADDDLGHMLFDTLQTEKTL